MVACVLADGWCEAALGTCTGGWQTSGQVTQTPGTERGQANSARDQTEEDASGLRRPLSVAPVCAMAGGHRVVPDRHLRLYPDLPGGLQRLIWGELAPCAPVEVDAHLHHVLPTKRVYPSAGEFRRRTGLARLCPAEVATSLRSHSGNRHPRLAAWPVAFARVLLRCSRTQMHA